MLNQDRLQEIKQRFSIIGNNEQLNRAIQRAYLVAPTDYSVLITGESGVGKEHFPKIIHTFSTRRHNNYFAINCGAIPNGTIDSELFGHIKGAFTGAVSDHKGYFEEANGGTIFLDEVGELPLETQVRLLRVLETGEFIRVGSSQVQKTNVRVVAATNVNLEEAIETGRFREDLYYRLSTISIMVPPLRERKDDIPILFRKFVSDCTERYNMPRLQLTEDALQLLTSYYFRGNIRQLKNIAEQVCVLEQKREINAATLRQYLPAEERRYSPARILNTDYDYTAERELIFKMIFEIKKDLDQLRQVVSHLSAGSYPHSDFTESPAVPQHIVKPVEEPIVEPIIITDDGYQPTEEISEKPSSIAAAKLNEPTTMQQMEKETIRQALQRNKGNRKQTAAELNMAERTLYRKIKEYEL